MTDKKKIPDYPVLEFIAKRSEPDGNGGRKFFDGIFYMDLRGSNATRDHVLHYVAKGFQIVQIHNASAEKIQENDNWREIAGLCNSINSQAQAINKRKPLADVVEKVKEKING